MDKKYFFFDIDGTLTDERDHRVVKSAYETIQKLKENGHFVAIATGRAHYKTLLASEEVDINNLVCCGGACIVLDGKVKENAPLDHDVACSILDICDSSDIAYLICNEDSDQVIMNDYKFIERCGFRKEITSYVYDKHYDYHKHDIFKIYVNIKKGEEKNYSWINSHSYLRLTDDYIVYQYDKKDVGIRKMMDIIGGDYKDVVVFGDGKNDLVMFGKEWFSIAMGNGNEELKKVADYITDTNINDGIKKACEHFGWI